MVMTSSVKTASLTGFSSVLDLLRHCCGTRLRTLRELDASVYGTLSEDSALGARFQARAATNGSESQPLRVGGASTRIRQPLLGISMSHCKWNCGSCTETTATLWGLRSMPGRE